MATVIVANAPSAGFPVGTKVKAYALKGANTITPASGPPPGAVVEEPAVAADGSLTYTGLNEGTFYLCAAEVAGTWRYLHVQPDVAATAPGVVATGTGTLASGKVTVPSGNVTATSRIFLQRTGSVAGAGVLSVTAIAAGTSFTVESSSGTDAGTFNYEIRTP